MIQVYGRQRAEGQIDSDDVSGAEGEEDVWRVEEGGSAHLIKTLNPRLLAFLY